MQSAEEETHMNTYLIWLGIGNVERRMNIKVIGIQIIIFSTSCSFTASRTYDKPRLERKEKIVQMSV